MGNMSYCRFENTCHDLQDCQDHIDDDTLSKDENKHRKQIIEICRDIARQYEDMDLDKTFEDNKESDE